MTLRNMWWSNPKTKEEICYACMDKRMEKKSDSHIDFNQVAGIRKDHPDIYCADCGNRVWKRPFEGERLRKFREYHGIKDENSLDD